jgi:hypothetical protein
VWAGAPGGVNAGNGGDASNSWFLFGITDPASPRSPTSGVANRGGGGGGAGWETTTPSSTTSIQAPGGNGGSGIVIIRYEA